MTPEEQLAAMLGRILFDVDYTTGKCRPNEMIGAVLDEDTLREAKALVQQADAARRGTGYKDETATEAKRDRNNEKHKGGSHGA